MRYRMIAAALAALAASPVAAQTVPATLPGAAPTSEHEVLGRHIAERGTLAALLPLMAAKDIAALIADHPELDDAARARLRSAAATTARAASDRLIAAVGHQYAMRLSLDDLKALSAFADSPAARHWRGAEPAVIAATAAALDGFDFRKDAWAAYCRAPGVACAAGK